MNFLKILIYFAIVLSASATILKFLQIWLLEKEQKSITKFMENVESRVSDISSEKLILTPIQYTNLFLDYFFGQRLFTWKIFKIISLISILLVISAVFLLSVITDKSEREFPWEMYSFSLQKLDKVNAKKEIQSEQISKRLNKLEGLHIALDNLDDVIALIRNSNNPLTAKDGLMKKFGLSNIQSQAILDMQLQRLTTLERDKILDQVNTEEVIKSKLISEGSIELEDKIERIEKFLSSLNTPFWAVIYTIFYILLCTFIAGVLGIISLSITRQFAREMVFAKGALTLISAAILNLILILLIAPAFTMIITIFSIPSIWAYYDIALIIPKLGVIWGSIIFTSLTSIISLFGWYFIIPSWTKAILIISFIPWICFVCLLIVGAISYIFKKPIYLTFARFLKRSLEWKSGPLGFISVIFFALSGLITLIIRIF